MRKKKDSVTVNQAKLRIEKLRQMINHQRYLYHTLDRQNISDEAHDSLKHELWRLEQQFPSLITPDSPTQRVGGEALEKFQKVEHTERMLSIEDLFSYKELSEWKEYLKRLSKKKKLEYFCELKVDGLAVALVYEHGVFSMGATRGNGQVGEDVTQNVKTIESVPLKLETFDGTVHTSIQKQVQNILKAKRIEIRGEVYIEKKDLEKLNKERKERGEPAFANTRNLAAGSIRQLNPKLAASRPLRFLAYDIVGDIGQTLHSEEHAILSAIGFKTDSTALACKDIKAVEAYWNRTGKKRDSFLFHIDGVVVLVNQNTLFGFLGIAGKSARGTRALKFSGEQTTTRVKDIYFQVGRTGAVTPVALLAPVQILGVTISRATLHNEDEAKRLGIRIGDTVVVQRAGDVIPEVVQVLKDLRDGSEKTFRMLKKCPVCGTKLTRPTGEAIWRCLNKECRAQKREFLYHFVSRKAFNIEGLGPKILDKLIDEHLISEPADIFELTEGDLVPLERFAEKSAANVVASIQGSKTVSFARFLYALSIRHVGEETALAVSEYFSSLDILYKTTKKELQTISDVGEVVAESIAEWFSDDTNKVLIKRLQKAGVTITQKKQKEERVKKLTTFTFVFTGSLSSLSRDEAKERIRELGGNATETVSHKTSYVVTGEEPGSKKEKAEKLHVPILTEKEFLKMIK